jgi:hypothetical protein
MSEATYPTYPVGRNTAAPATASSEEVSVTNAVRKLGFWAALATAVTYITFDAFLILGSAIPVPWDVYIPIGASLLLAPSFVLLTISLHHSAPSAARLWTHSAVVFATIYAALVSLVYVTWLFVVEPHVIAGTESEVELFLFGPGSFIQMVDAIGYTFMGVAVFFTAAAFPGRGVRWIRWLALASGPAALGVFLSYVTYITAIGAPGGLITPAYAILVALYFRRAPVAAE